MDVNTNRRDSAWWAFPVAAYNFAVEVDGTFYPFREVSGLDVTIVTKPKTEDNIQQKVPTGERQFSNVTLKRGITDTFKGDFFAKWVEKVEASPSQFGALTKEITIYLMDDQGYDIMAWHLEKAFPIKYSVGPLNASQNEVATETIELSHKGFKKIAV